MDLGVECMSPNDTGPPPEVQALISKTAEFVRQHPSTDVEQRILVRDPKRFAFLQEDHAWHPHYKRALLGVPSGAEEQKTHPGGVAAPPSSNESQSATVQVDACSFERYIGYKDFFPALRSASKTALFGGCPSEWQSRRHQLHSAPTALELEMMRSAAVYAVLQENASKHALLDSKLQVAGSNSSPNRADLYGHKPGLSHECLSGRDTALELTKLLEDEPRLLSFLLPQHAYHPIFCGFLDASREIMMAGTEGHASNALRKLLSVYEENEWAVFSDALRLVRSRIGATSGHREDVRSFARTAQAFALGALPRAEKIDSIAVNDHLPLIGDVQKPRPDSRMLPKASSRGPRTASQQFAATRVGVTSQTSGLRHSVRGPTVTHHSSLSPRHSFGSRVHQKQTSSATQRAMVDSRPGTGLSDVHQRRPFRFGPESPLARDEAEHARRAPERKRPSPFGAPEWSSKRGHEIAEPKAGRRT
ncbi:hypothetical protein CCYA_CCYA02G0788 [Cyanidiococcus yangmingshanensis]|nr:hypothetical protein CCYA_CCYA02G0788 [Cyanidiococcus yangmingshanensis]